MVPERGMADHLLSLFASVLVGYNETNHELLFVESWAGLKFPRRMRTEELEATAYLTKFVLFVWD